MPSSRHAAYATTRWVLSLGVAVPMLVALGCGPSIGDVRVIDGMPHVYEGVEVWAPAWILAPQAHTTGVIAAVGMYGPTRYRETGRRRAADDGRAALSRSVWVRVQSVVQSWAEDGVSYFTGAGAGRDVVETISRHISDVPLPGAVEERAWTHPVSGMNYALISIGDEEAQDAVTPIVNRAARENQNSFVAQHTAEALRELDRLLDRGLTDTPEGD
jgi:hypothetical protein